MKCCLLSNVQVSQNSFSRVYCNSENEPLFPFEIELPSVPDHELINPLHPMISMHILHNVLYTFPKMLTRRIWLTIKSFFSW